MVKKLGGSAGSSMDHRDSSIFYDNIESATDGMLKFMEDTGSVRVSINKDTALINVHGNKPLNPKQIAVIKKATIKKV